MRNRSSVGVLLLVAGMDLVVHGQGPVIGSLGQNGLLVCTNLLPGTVASVEWAPTLTGPWTNSWEALKAITVDSNGGIAVSVPMFYRVRGVAAPPNMALIPSGSFMMGDGFGEPDFLGRVIPPRSVQVDGFFVDRHEVTKGLWDDVYQWATNHGYSLRWSAEGRATNHPAQMVTWDDAACWCNARSEKEGRPPAYYTDALFQTVYRTVLVKQGPPYVKPDAGYRLPTEAEWEKAARGGASGHRFPWADVDTISHLQANYQSSTNSSYDVSSTRGFHPEFGVGDPPFTSPVGSFAPNGYGVFDMAGNVWEWCWDAFSSDYRMIRGGGYYESASRCRVTGSYFAYRASGGTSVGFRCVLSQTAP